MNFFFVCGSDVHTVFHWPIVRNCCLGLFPTVLLLVCRVCSRAAAPIEEKVFFSFLPTPKRNSHFHCQTRAKMFCHSVDRIALFGHPTERSWRPPVFFSGTTYPSTRVAL